MPYGELDKFGKFYFPKVLYEEARNQTDGTLFSIGIGLRFSVRLLPSLNAVPNSMKRFPSEIRRLIIRG
jgi:hypothetical protein